MFTMQLAYQKPLLGKSVGIVFGAFAPMHQGHLDQIITAKRENDAGCLVIVCGSDNDKGGCKLPLRTRYLYAREFFKDDDLVAVYAIDDTKLGFDDYSYDNWGTWINEFEKIKKIAVDKSCVDQIGYVWYVGEKEYCDDLESLGMHVNLMDRTANNISGTMIRNNPLKHWDKIVPTYRRVFSKNILVIGTASEGKTNLVMDLGKYFSTAFAHEWPRDYMEKYSLHDCDLGVNDFISFLHGQHNHMLECIESDKNRGIFFCDTDAAVTNMYARHYALDPECALSMDDYVMHIRPLAEHYINNTHWDKIYVLPPKSSSFADDHVRYMKDADYDRRMNLYNDLNRYIEKNASCEYLHGDYMDNFLTIKNYVNSEITKSNMLQ